MAFYEVKGLDEVRKRLEHLAENVQRKLLQTGLAAAIEPLRRAIERNIPVDTGDLRDSLIVKAARTKNGRVGIFVRTGTGDTYYALFVENGWKDKPGVHYTAKAFESEKHTMVDLSVEEILKAIEEAS